MSEIYNRIRIRRQELGLTTDELAKKMGYKDRSSISKIENGKADIPQSKVKEFAEALDTSVSWLLGIDQAEEKSQPKLSKGIYITDTSDNEDSISHAHHHYYDEDARTHISRDGAHTGLLDYAFDEPFPVFADDDDDDYADIVAKKRMKLEKSTSSNPSSSSVTQPADKPSQQLHQEHNDKQPESPTCLPQDASEHSDYIQELIELPMSDKPQKVLKKTFCDNLLVCSSFPDNIQCDFAMLCDDDSMSGIGICKDDIAYVKKIDFVPRNGTIIAISIDKKALLRRIYSDSNYIEFRPENSGFKAIIVDKSHGTPPEILGVLVGFTHCISQSSTEDDFFDFL